MGNSTQSYEQIVGSNYADELIVNSILLYTGVFGNILMLIHLLKTRKQWNRVSFFLLWLCVSELVGVGVRQGVTIAWQTNVIWKAGEAVCKICMMFLMFGNTLAHYVLASLNIDNMFTVVCYRSLKVVRILLVVASLIITTLVNAPKAFIYSVQEFPNNPAFTQCVSFGYFESSKTESIYFHLTHIGMIWLPMLIISITGLAGIIIWCKKNGKLEFEETKKSNAFDMNTFNVDIGMVTAFNIVFIICWTPTSVVSLYDRHVGLHNELSSSNVKLLWDISNYITILNSCINPVIYGVAACMRRPAEKSSSL